MLCCIGAAPASQPTHRIRSLVEQLNDRDGQRRDDALRELLSLRADHLPLLRQAVADARPLTPGQISLLRQAVRHIYITGVHYPVAPNDLPFLGLSWESPNTSDEWKEMGGVPVTRRIPGFSAYQMLREGDIIRGIEELPGIPLASTKDVGEAVSAFKAGQSIHLQIIRNGKVMTVEVLLRNKPLEISLQTRLDDWVDQQTAAADQYWDNFFAQVLEENVI
jgi:hypothetical protein